MIRINLLPYRDEARKAKRKQFYSLAVLITVLAGLVVFLGYSILEGYVSRQNGQNEFLKNEIAALEKQLTEIKGIREQTSAVVNRKRAIEMLQANRGETVHLLGELATQTPEGVYLKSIKQSGTGVTLVGYAQSNSKISTFMRNISSSEWMENPRLIEVKAIVVDGRRQNEFSMEFQMVQQGMDDGAVQPGKGKK